ncbi:cytochrome P450 9e2-like [Lasioglossum baleicum]|uniref:cytochrome P450 9e2-like n=1 Tax=Lasioglossum baleicum TaxID=434251 RepID=UPI003FCC3BC4
MDPLSILLATVAVAMAVYYYAFRGLNFFKKHGIDHVTPTAVVGNMGRFLLRKEPLCETIKRTYYHNPDAKYVGFYEFNQPIIMLRDIELIKSVMIRNSESFTDHRPFLEPGLNHIFDKMLIIRKGDDWKLARTQVTPIFTSSKIKSMYLLMNEVAARIALHLTKLPAEERRELELRGLLQKYANDVILSCVLGLNVDTLKEPNNPYYKYLNLALNFNGFWMAIKFMLQRNMTTLAKLLGVKMMTKETEDFFDKTIRDNMKYREENGVRSSDMLQHLLDLQTNEKIERRINTKEIVSHAFSFYFGGYDTTASQTSLILHTLLAHPEHLAKLQEEVDEVMEYTKGQVTYEAIAGMEYMDAVINEAMRLYPIAVFLDRQCTKNFELPPAVPGGKPFTVKKGTSLWIPIHEIQTDPKYFNNPDQFDPDRFIQDGKKILSSGTYMPFGMGPRICIGNRFALTEMKVIIFHILALCDLKTCAKTEIPLKMSVNLFTNGARGGYWFRVEPRKNCSKHVDNLLSNTTRSTEIK